MEVYMVEVIPNLIFGNRNWILPRFQHVSYYGNARRLGTAGKVQHAPWFVYGQNGQLRVFAHHNCETQYVMKEPHAEVREEKKLSIVLPGHIKLEAAIERSLAMVHENLLDGCLPCQNGTAKNLHTHSRCNRTGGLPPNRTPSPPEILHALAAPPGDNE